MVLERMSRLREKKRGKLTKKGRKPKEAEHYKRMCATVVAWTAAGSVRRC
jgi:hypothetical protein